MVSDLHCPPRCRVVAEVAGAEHPTARSGRPLAVWENPAQVDEVFGLDVGPDGMGMRWKVEGFFMINEYYMALVNDNDFGLEGNTHTRLAIIQLQERVELDPCLLNPVCSDENAPTACAVPSVPAKPFALESLPELDLSLQHCDFEKGWETLVNEYMQDETLWYTGGLGKLMQTDVIEVWMCYRDHRCSTEGNYMCWVYHEADEVWIPWSTNQKLELYLTGKSPLVECPKWVEFASNSCPPLVGGSGSCQEPTVEQQQDICEEFSANNYDNECYRATVMYGQSSLMEESLVTRREIDCAVDTSTSALIRSAA